MKAEGCEMFKKFDPPAEVRFDANEKDAYKALSDFIIDFFKTTSYCYDSVLIGIWTDTLKSDVVFGDLNEDKIEFLTDWYEGGRVKVRYIVGLLTLDSIISNNMM